MEKLTSSEYFEASKEHDRKDNYAPIVDRLSDPAIKKEIVQGLIEGLEVSLKLDLVKRRLVYGDTHETEKYKSKEKAYSELLLKLKSSLDNDFVFDGELIARLTHYTLGLFTESGELIENLLDYSLTGELNVVNAREERGDIAWFSSQHSRACGSHPEEDMASNERKLGGVRYKNGYSDNAAINRNTDEELKKI